MPAISFKRAVSKILYLSVVDLFLLAFFITCPAAGHDFSGYIATEARYFPHSPLFQPQEQNNGSLALQFEYEHKWESGTSFTFVPFARLDSADSQRSHFDIRELNFLFISDDWEMQFGFGKVFWGVTEFVHLVDIINQTDLVESFDGEEKLGQPMVDFSFMKDWGTIDFFVLPYFVERTFPGAEGRLRFSQLIDTNKTIYESAAGRQHFDFAARYFHSVGSCDFGIYNFYGTSREPTLLPGFDTNSQPVLIPYYEQINQTGIEIQVITGAWLVKLESIYRTGQGDDFFATVGGFEYTFVGIFQTDINLGVVGEWAYDDRNHNATTFFENDVIIGIRLSLNDAAGSELLAGISQDLDSSSKYISIEVSRRIGSNAKLFFELDAFIDQPKDDIFYDLRDDDFGKIEFSYYF